MELESRIDALLRNLFALMADHPKDAQWSIDKGVSQALVRLRVNRADYPRVRGRERGNEECLAGLLGYIAAQYGLSARLFHEEPNHGQQAKSGPFKVDPAWASGWVWGNVLAIAGALFGAHQLEAVDTGTMSTAFLIHVGATEMEARLVQEYLAPLFKASWNKQGRRLFVDIIPSKEDVQPKTAAGRFAK